jgi:hypothetical protein
MSVQLAYSRRSRENIGVSLALLVSRKTTGERRGKGNAQIEEAG